MTMNQDDLVASDRVRFKREADHTRCHHLFGIIRMLDARNAYVAWEGKPLGDKLATIARSALIRARKDER